MADATVPVKLDRGLDLVSPALLAEPGSLIDCLNYETTDGAGYRRIDGYERYDGYPNGSVYRYFVATVVATVGGNQPLIVAGSTISRPIAIAPGLSLIGEAATDEVGIVVGTGPTTNSYAYVPNSADGSLLATQLVTIQPPTGASFTATVTVTAVDGKTLAPVFATYISNLRTYSTVLRGLVTSPPTPVAGLWWLNDNLYGAIDAVVINYVNSPIFGPYPSVGTIIRHQGILYYMLGYQANEATTAPVAGEVNIILMPIGTSGTVNNNVAEVTSADVLVTTHGANGTIIPTAYSGNYAYVVKFNAPADSTARGYTRLNPIVRIPFDAGTYATETPPIDVPTAVGSVGLAVKHSGILRQIVKNTGSFMAGTAAGFAYIELTGTAVGGSTIKDNYVITASNTTTTLATVNAPIANDDLRGPLIAGTRRLIQAGTRYVSVNNNFYGDLSFRATYFATGASRAGYCDGRSFGNIYTQENTPLDEPKYVAVHMSRLALGFVGGSIQRSVAGDPTNFSGVQGADEIPTGDTLTGLLEMPDDSLVCFGKRTIRRITGGDDVTTQLTNVSSNGGCFDYTAVLVGTNAVFTGVNGISSLDQTEKYGDFQGERLSDAVASWLRPKLLIDDQSFETGGTAMAYAVRSKNQYRLVLKDGDVLTVTLASDGGATCTTQRYSTVASDLRVPFAWSSQIAENGKERIHVVWDRALAQKGVLGVIGTLPSNTRVYELDSGWGFDGEYFQHYFDTAHVFNDKSEMMGIEKIRLYGRGYGVASLNVKSSGIEDDFDQAYHDRVQDISLPATPVLFYDKMMPVTCIVDQQNWGLGVKLRIQNSTAIGSALTEPSHVCQVLLLHLRTEGAKDS